MNHEELTRFVAQAFDKAKYGEALQMYDRILPYFNNGNLQLKSHYAFGWIIYYALHQSERQEIKPRKHMLGVYLKLSLKVPHKLHSMVMTEAIRLYKEAKEVAYNQKDSYIVSFSIIRFMKLWNLNNLRPGDWNRKEHNGKTMSSTVEKLITVYVDEMEATNTLPTEEIKQLIDKAIDLYPDSYNLLCQQASLHILSGEKNEAAKLLRKALIVAPGKFYLWSRLASLISSKDQPHLHVALLYKALISPGPDQFKGKVRISLADALASRGAFPQALYELQKVKSLYEQNGWHLSSVFLNAYKKIPQGTIADNPEKMYRKIEHLADEEVYSCLPYLNVTKTYHKNPSPDDAQRSYGKPAVAWRVTDKTGQNYWLKPERFGIQPNLPLGTALSVRVHNGKPVNVKLISDNDTSLPPQQ